MIPTKIYYSLELHVVAFSFPIASDIAKHSYNNTIIVESGILTDKGVRVL